jgi:ArsR family transcriptional regulator, arsenate/arsenite/antimonite-responsive transcriptional repressor
LYGGVSLGLQDAFSIISDPVRRQIIEMLRKEKMSAGDLAAALNMTPPAVSYHLKKLKEADLVYETKYKNYIYYELNLSVLDEVFVWLSKIVGGSKNEA